MMRSWHQSVLVFVCMALFAGQGLAAPAPKKKAPPTKPKLDLMGLLGAGGVAQGVSDLRKAAESFQRFGETLKQIAPVLAGGLVESSHNLANIGQGFDPLGLKAAVALIREQQQIIGTLQQAEIQRLKAECERLRQGRTKPKPHTRPKRGKKKPKQKR